MSGSSRTEQAGDLYVTWSRCLADNHDHAVTDEEFARGVHQQNGQFSALCGHRLLIASSLMPPGPPCGRCRAYLAARATLRDAAERFEPPKRVKKGLRSRILRRSRSSATTFPQRDGGPESPAGTGCASTAPVSAGRHTLRSDR
jgi:hypothetical protein